VRVYKEKEEEIKRILAEAPRADEILSLLSTVGLDMEQFTALYGDARIAEAVRHAKDLKDRYTVLWLYYDLFGEEAL
jgi:hypothetical protein